MIKRPTYNEVHNRYGVVVVRRGTERKNIEFAYIPDILNGVKIHELKNKVWVRRIKAEGLLDRYGNPFPKGSIIRKSLPTLPDDKIILEYNTRSKNLCLYHNDARKDILYVGDRGS